MVLNGCIKTEEKKSKKKQTGVDGLTSSVLKIGGCDESRNLSRKIKKKKLLVCIFSIIGWDAFEENIKVES